MWSWIEIALGAAVAAVLGLALWVRLAPVEPTRWHVDPLSAEAPGGNGWLVAPGGHAEPPRIDAAPEEVLARLDRAAMAEPRTRRIAGGVDEGRITYESRSRLWGFPDYTTVTAVEDGDAAKPVLLGRARFGRGDLGVNRARIERWLAALK